MKVWVVIFLIVILFATIIASVNMFVAPNIKTNPLASLYIMIFIVIGSTLILTLLGRLLFSSLK